MAEKKLGNSRCQCGGCDEYFNSEAAFTKHRIGSYAHKERRCLSESEMLGAGMCKNADGFWVTALRGEFAHG